jgi:hypothetical protein
VAKAKEVIVTNEKTGGKKGSKLARFDLIPAHPLQELAEVYGKGARKYADRNWELGYDWGLSYAAMIRHANEFWKGNDNDDHDPDCPADCINHTEGPHLAQVAWHAFALLEFSRTHPELDNRSKEKNNG